MYKNKFYFKERTMTIIPERLKKGDKIMIVAPARGLKLIGADCRQIAEERLAGLGLKVEFAPNTTDENFDLTGSASVEKRVADLMTAFADKSVKAVLTVIGGFNSNQMVKHLDYDVIRQNPKIFMGFSDITALHAAIYAQTGLVTYYGPHYSSLGMKKGCEYTLENMVKALFEGGKREILPSAEWSDDLWFLDQDKREFVKNDGWWQIQGGEAKGTIIGGNLCTFNLHLGTPYRPKFEKDTILFLEDDDNYKKGSFYREFARNFDSLMQSNIFEVKGLVFGKFQKSCNVTRKHLDKLIREYDNLKNIPVVYDYEFGHNKIMRTIPIGKILKKR